MRPSTSAWVSSSVMPRSAKTRPPTPVPLDDETEQQVLGAEPGVAERAGLLLGEDDGLAGAVGESLEHGPVESFFYGVAENPTAHFLFSAERMIGLSGRGRVAGMGQSSNRPRVTQAG